MKYRVAKIHWIRYEYVIFRQFDPTAQGSFGENDLYYNGPYDSWQPCLCLYMEHESCPCSVYMSHVPVVCTWNMSHVPVVCTWNMSHVPVVCTWNMSHVPVVFT
jgi:hypothetical protein